MGRTEGGSGFGARELRKKGKEDRCYVALLLRVSAALERDGAVKSEQGEAIREETRITKNHDNKDQDKDKDNDKK
ncbi:hypothetical protein PGQ11_011511 [Apiospora arundinis]|uniref:Uncharacterized protein n=1 Tax=Apiospora arundinis TaxID=335852 RepID=A0ABR2HZW2_9PEZI